MSQRGFAHVILIALLGIAVIGVIVYSAIRNSNNPPNQIAITSTQTPDSTINPSPIPTIKAVATPINKATTKPTPRPTDNAVIDKYNTCGTYDETKHPPLPAKGDKPLLVYLYPSGGSVYGIVGYQWDFEGDGIWDTGTITVKTSHVYSQSGQFSPKFRVVGANSSVSVTCSYPFDVTVGTKPEFQNDIIIVDKLNFEYTVSKSRTNFDFPWYIKRPEDNTKIYMPAFNVSSKDKFTFAGTKKSSYDAAVYVYETGANLDPGTSSNLHFAISKSQPNGTYQGSIIITYTTENGTVVNNGPTVNYKVTITD